MKLQYLKCSYSFDKSKHFFPRFSSEFDIWIKKISTQTIKGIPIFVLRKKNEKEILKSLHSIMRQKRCRNASSK
jgi:hypothetical protein